MKPKATAASEINPQVYNVYSYIRFAKRLKEKKNWEKERATLNFPIVLLVMFLIGYLVVGIFGQPDLVMSGILFGGSIFVYVIFRLIQRIANRFEENEKLLNDRLVGSEFFLILFIDSLGRGGVRHPLRHLSRDGSNRIVRHQPGQGKVQNDSSNKRDQEPYDFLPEIFPITLHENFLSIRFKALSPAGIKKRGCHIIS